MTNPKRYPVTFTEEQINYLMELLRRTDGSLKCCKANENQFRNYSGTIESLMKAHAKIEQEKLLGMS